MSTAKPVLMLTLVLTVLGCVVLSGCGLNGSGGGEKAAPTFCPDKYRADIATPLAANSPSRAYYQNLFTTVDTPLDIILFTCDPDHPMTSEGLSWEVAVPPLWDGPPPPPYHGDLSAYAGTYPLGGIITYTPFQGYLGTDSFTFHVWDGVAWGNTAEIRITVAPPQPSATSLYFIGMDDVSNMHLWSYNSVGGLSTIPGSASILNARGTQYIVDGEIFRGDLYLMGDLGDGGGALYSYNLSSGMATRSSGFPTYRSNLVTRNNILYMGFSDINGLIGYLWATDGSSSVYTVAGTAGLNIENIASFGGSLLFDGDDTVPKQLWSRNSAGSLSTLSSISFGAPFSQGLYPEDFTAFNNELYFVGNTNQGLRTLYRFNGSSPITTVGNLEILYSQGSSLAVFDSLLCINARATGNTGQLWTYHPVNGFNQVTNNTMYDVSPDHMTEFAGRLFFRGYSDMASQSNLMYTDGNVVGTISGTADFYINSMAVYDNKLFFGSGNFSNDQLFYVDASLGAPTQVSFISTANARGGLAPSGLIEY